MKRRVPWAWMVLALVGIAAAATGAGAQQTATAPAEDTVAPGIVHGEIVRPDGPWRAEVVTVRLRDRRYRLEARHAGGATLRGRERTSVMAARLTAAGDTVLAAINGDFFDLATGENENNQVVDGVLLKGVPVSDSPWDTFRNPHTQLGVGRDGRVFIDRFAFAGALVPPGASRGAAGLRLDGVNLVPRRGAGLVLFTAARGGASRVPGAPARNGPRDPDAPSGPPPRAGAPDPDSAGAPVEVVLRARPGGDAWTPRYRIEGSVHTVAADSIEPGSARLVAYGSAARARLDSLVARGRSVVARLALRPDRGPLAQVIGGWPRLVVDGRNVGALADSLEGTFPSFSARRHARSAVGLSRDSTTLYLVAVDGPKRTPDAARADSAANRTSAGMTLQELGDFMIGLGAWQAMNLDGGGSTTLIAGGRLLNQPSDPDGERRVGNALFLVRRR